MRGRLTVDGLLVRAVHEGEIAAVLDHADDGSCGPLRFPHPVLRAGGVRQTGRRGGGDLGDDRIRQPPQGAVRGDHVREAQQPCRIQQGQGLGRGFGEIEEEGGLDGAVDHPGRRPPATPTGDAAAAGHGKRRVGPFSGIVGQDPAQHSGRVQRQRGQVRGGGRGEGVEPACRSG
ncbi:hypothetical protein KP696_06140 [Nocardia seriolae]|nr:hypothetical protein [Nocardia seriolae]MTJ65461.1 hypothetical protein [Nocardia seriolae]MTJ70886.1 hypothetical protein [Nocardia seriolae]MTJ90347.1 hypothetical protein [Nocardia seriolae]MTK34308.1 hypothetical protein [Nocardia seriolae]MTK43448.1 hypothetical protein [Nocardia seriolae]